MPDYDSQGSFTFHAQLSPELAGDFYSDLTDGDRRRLRRYATGWSFYLGRHWDFEREDGDPLVVLNYIKPICNKKIAALIRRGVQWDMDLPFRGTLLKDVLAAWEANGGGELLWRIAQMGSVTGDHFVLVTYRDATDVEKVTAPNIPGYPVIELFNSSQVFPVWDPQNRDRMLRCTIIKLFYYPKADAPDQLEVRHIKMTITPEEIVEEYPYDDGSGHQLTSRRPNIFGEVSVVHWCNEPNSADRYGPSDVLDLVPPQRELNEKMTDISDIIAYHASPIIVVFGARISQIDKSAKTVWSNLPTDAKVETLEAKSDLTASKDYIDRIRTAMHEIGNVPEGSLGSKDWKGETGEVLASRMQPLTEAKDRKVASWTPGLRRINYFILRTINLMWNRALPYDRDAVSSGLIIPVVETQSNAVNQSINVTTKQIVVEYDEARDRPRVLTADEVKELSEGENAVEDAVYRHPQYDNVPMRRLEIPNPRPANPLRCDPIFPDTLPKDVLQTMNVLSQIATLNLADREWLMSKVPLIDNDEIPNIMRKLFQQRVEDNLLTTMMQDETLSEGEPEAIQKLVDSAGDPKVVLHVLAKLQEQRKEELEAEEAAAQQAAQGTAAGQTNTVGRGGESRQIQPGKKRRGEK